MDPLGENQDKSNLLDHFENLAKIFNEKVEIVSEDKNPIRELKKQENILQILPLKQSMLKPRIILEIFIYKLRFNLF